MEIPAGIESNIVLPKGESCEALLKRLAYSTSILIDVSQALQTVIQNCESGETSANPSIIRQVHQRLQQFEERSNKVRIIEEDFRDDIQAIHRKYPQLSRPEVRTAVFLRLGFTTKQIAELSYSSKRTVDTHRTNIRKKLGINEKFCLTRFFQNSAEGQCPSICVNSEHCAMREAQEDNKAVS